MRGRLNLDLKKTGTNRIGTGNVTRTRTRTRTWARWMLGLIGLIVGLSPAHADGTADALDAWTAQFARGVDHRLDVPLVDQQRYLLLLDQALLRAQVQAQAGSVAGQALLLVDRSAQVQAAMLVVRTQAEGWHWLGATAVSTGKVGTYEHFRTPLGVFIHSLDNPDFRAEGTFNENHIRGYGLRGMRVFDFGWQAAERGWGAGGNSLMRLQMHATDPDVLAQRLGSVASEGCIRIPATLNVFLDRHGVLDAEYEEALAAGDKLWIIRKKDRALMPWPGRYMVVIDSLTAERPTWSPGPALTPPPAKAKPGALAHRPALPSTVKASPDGAAPRPPSPPH